MKTNYYEQRATLRGAAIADIRAYLEKNGDVVVKNLLGGPTYSPHRIDVRIVEPYVVIGKASATVTDTRTLCLIADMLNQMP